MPRRDMTTDHEFADEELALDLEPLERIVSEHYVSPADLIPVLQEAQRHYGYLPEPVVTEIARLTSLPASRIYGVVTFYAQFSTVPAGRHQVCVCPGTACHVRGAHEVLRAVERELDVEPGQTTPDLEFSLETVACLGACSFSPVMTVDGQYFVKMKGSRVPPILREFGARGEGDRAAGGEV